MKRFRNMGLFDDIFINGGNKMGGKVLFPSALFKKSLEKKGTNKGYLKKNFEFPPTVLFPSALFKKVWRKMNKQRFMTTW